MTNNGPVPSLISSTSCQCYLGMGVESWGLEIQLRRTGIEPDPFAILYCAVPGHGTARLFGD